MRLLLSCTVHPINPGFKVVMLGFQTVGIGIDTNMPTIPDNTPLVVRTMTPRYRQRRQLRVTYLFQILLAVAMTFFAFGLWFGGSQTIFRNFSHLANVSSRKTGLVLCGRGGTGLGCNVGTFIT